MISYEDYLISDNLYKESPYKYLPWVWNHVLNFKLVLKCINVRPKKQIICLVDFLGVLTPLSAIFQLYHSDQF
jgi:hypothetical protein